jgi:hypothetical protein
MTAPLGVILPTAQTATDYMASPYADEDWELWACLLLDTFGTRNFGVAHAFMRQLGDMIPKEWDVERQAEVVNMELYQQALSIVASLKPRNEAEAAIAVHCVALHLTTFKVTDHMASRSWLDPHTASALAAITKAFTAQVKALREMQSPAKAKRQVIKVQKSVTVNYDARQVHFHGGGSGQSGSQPDETRAQRAHATPAGIPVEVTALPSPDEGGEVLSFARREGEACLQDARGRKGKRSAEG